MTNQPVTERLRGRIPELDGVRGIAILMVMLYHFKLYGVWWTARPGFGWYQVCNFGWAGVNVFFVLSGFLITGILFDARQSESYYRVFYARRTLRIFPLYYAALAIVFFALPPLLKQAGLAGAALQVRRTPQWPAWCYVQNWTVALAGGAAVSTLISHFWSLGIEEQFYLVWPFFVRRLGERRRIMALAAALVVGAPFLRWAMHRAGIPDAAYLLTVCQMDALAAGAFAALGMRGEADGARLRKWAPWVACAAGAGIIVVIAISRRVHYGGILMDTAGFSAIDLLVAACIVRAAAGLRLLRGNLLRFFGKYSYGLYVVHQPVIYLLACSGLTATALTAQGYSTRFAIAVVNAMGFGISLALALASWHLLEKHFLRLKDAVPRGFPARRPS